ncbi:hypothetical protein AVEN_134945-1 [Araneus ventricosus]|uniref:Uncharacterized protein n=1 Tax=Araneus ventricosus TaxID=182803 RepID=A0A4Y2CKB8_ARAVE|nr:hypothetical protein AVEN_134945-1 [Araneus ventricosus]
MTQTRGRIGVMGFEATRAVIPQTRGRDIRNLKEAKQSSTKIRLIMKECTFSTFGAGFFFAAFGLGLIGYGCILLYEMNCVGATFLAFGSLTSVFGFFLFSTVSSGGVYSIDGSTRSESADMEMSLNPGGYFRSRII